MNKYSPVVSVRISKNLLEKIDAWADNNSVSRSAAINYLLARKIAEELKKDIIDK